MSAEIIDIREARERRFRSGPPPQVRSKLERDAFAAFEDGPRDPPPGGWAA